VSWGTIIVFWVVWVVVGVAIAQAKNRSVREAVLCCAVLGLIGVVMVACWKKVPAGTAAAGWYPDASGSGLERYWNGVGWSDLPPRPPQVSR
jgi:hypothetical protein